MNITQEYYLICVLYSFVIVSGINPFQFHVGNFDNKNSIAEHVYIRGKHFLKNDNEEDEKSEGRKGVKHPDKSSSIDRTPHSWFSQCIDHFNSSCSGENVQRWNQRYWINSDSYKPGGPIFFMFGGEGSAEGYVDAGKWLDFAEDFGALAVCLEHRFYGQSFIPSLDNSFESMSLLTSQQALADAALFIQWLKYNNSGATNLDNAKVVTFGGSYPGNLAAWMRQNYPNIVNLAVASSAPVEAKLEFPEFLRTVSEVIYQQDPTCFRKIYGAFRCMDNLVNDLQCNETEAWSVYASPQELLDGLHQCRPYNFSVNFERQQFFHNLGARWGSNFPGHRSTSKCHTLVLQNNLDVIEDYGNFLVQTGQTRETCQRSEKDLSAALRTPHAEKTRFDEDPEDEIVEFVKSLSGRDGKSWTWQTCYEFGYFQVADPEIQLFSDEWDSLIDIRRCQSIFPDANFTRKSIQSRIDLTNAFYKGKKFEGSCTIFVNGQWDPWHSLGFNQQNETTSRNTVISIPQAEHCEDMKSHPNPSVFMYQAQQRIREQIGKYLMDPNC